MPPKLLPDDTCPPVLRLNSDLWQARMRARGHATVVAQAQATGISRSQLVKILAGRVQPQPETARKLAHIVGAELPQVFKVAKP